ICDRGNGRVVEEPGNGDPQTTVLSGINFPWGMAIDVPTSFSTLGQQVTLRATVQTSPAGGAPTGNVTFKDGATTLGTGSLSASPPYVATLETSSLVVGNHQLTATYGGDASFAASAASMPVPLNVAPGTEYNAVAPYRICDTRGANGLTGTDAQCAGQR